MLTLLIVDDDIDIVSGLSETIPWTQCGIENVLKAYSGEEAMEIISETHVDIMVTDIKMPGIDGIELLERVTEKMIAPKTIILSGYAEFEYAQSALGLGAIGYVLKPVKVQELMDLVGRTVDSLLFQRRCV